MPLTLHPLAARAIGDTVLVIADLLLAMDPALATNVLICGHSFTVAIGAPVRAVLPVCFAAQACAGLAAGHLCLCQCVLCTGAELRLADRGKGCSVPRPWPRDQPLDQEHRRSTPSWIFTRCCAMPNMTGEFKPAIDHGPPAFWRCAQPPMANHQSWPPLGHRPIPPIERTLSWTIDLLANPA